MDPNHNANPEAAFAPIREKAKQHRESMDASDVPVIHIGMATCGIASGALETRAAFEEILAERGIGARIHPVGCIGHCYAEPVVIIENPGFPPILYHQVTPGKARMLVKSFLEMGDPLFEYLMGAMVENDMIPQVWDFPRFNMEERLVMENCGRVDPEEIDDYLAHGGYRALVKALQLAPAAIVGEVKAAGLRGRGGAGFPTGLKWELAAKGRRGGKDRHLQCRRRGSRRLHGPDHIGKQPPSGAGRDHAICAHAVGAQKAIVYVRAEYPLAVKMVSRAMEQAEALGLLGREILGTSFSLDMEVFQGSGAFVCGEETALIQSMEGRRGMPTYRPPFPVEKGLRGQPTVINNVKTFATVPSLINQGADRFREIGTEKSPGTAIFSVVGNVRHAGLVEIPMGVDLRTLVFDTCGGIPNKKAFKAVQIGGPSGGCLPADFLDTPIDFDSLTKAGAMMGSGGMVVMDEDTCMVDVARYFLDFTQKESCGKCTFCRVGTHHLLEILVRITKGEGREGDLEILEALSEDIKAGSLCGLGKTAPNPVLTSLKYFRDEYEAHIKEKRCPACMCRDLTAFYIDLDKCARGCDACVGCCPVEAIFTTPNRKKGIDQSLCVKCGECVTACPPEYDAVVKVSPPHLAPIVERPVEEVKGE